MQPFYTEQQTMLATTVREFAAEKLAPRADEVDTLEEFPIDQFRGLAELGLTGMTIPEEFGGSGGGYRDFMVVLEEVAAACGSTSTVLITHVSLGSQTINQAGSDEQRQRWLPSLASGQKIAAFALTEAGTGSDALALETSLTRAKSAEGKDEYILNGSKLFCTNGAVADVFSVFTNHDRAAGHRGVTAVVVEKGTPGFTVNPQHGKMGMKGCATAELVFDDCRIPVGNRLGEEGEGYRIALKILDSSRIMIAAQCLGLAKGALEAALSYAKQRETFGRVLATRQAIQFMLADMATELDAARLLTYRAAALYDEGLPHGKESAMAKLYASEAAGRIASKALQIHGGVGYFKPSVVERIYRDQRVTEIYEGTSEIQRLVISRALIGDI
ncbi:MAG: acyl-CoA dehydrogenase family protein [Chloroflexi bacterium]|nr:acyl-CoA dehydrogenase family protein [Chloroflexota bacterium]MCI0850648.1 acyl-CoA dehydrogenase family protein [Chloroflexota bacterium]MCI0870534.1 acyl-CoA dehydrogenase family protein [Chloroflexota bacterium]MCI0873819.1 acyl-CoA dehydrogenase family protein [Chloroflexota bacterium]